ncbi:MAG: hypothetical protein ACREH8_22935, partial [Opitutaceae bacterium]
MWLRMGAERDYPGWDFESICEYPQTSRSHMKIRQQEVENRNPHPLPAKTLVRNSDAAHPGVGIETENSESLSRALMPDGRVKG